MTFAEKTFGDRSFLLCQRTPCTEISQGKLLQTATKSWKFAKVLSLKSFPLYGNCYHLATGCFASSNHQAIGNKSVVNMHLVCNHFKHCTPLCFVLISIYQTMQDCGLVSDPPYSGGGERVQWRRGPVHTGTVEETVFFRVGPAVVLQYSFWGECTVCLNFFWV